MKTIEIDEKRIVWYELDSAASTMDYAVELTGKGCFPPVLVTAEKQSSGRGTHGRNWISPQGKGIYLSLVVTPPENAMCLEDLSVRTAGVLVETLKSYYDLPFKIKPPNDVLIGGCKVAGILYESVTRGDEVLSLILGLGLNLNQSIRDFEDAGLPDATSLIIEAGYVPERESLLISFLKKFMPMYRESTKRTEHRAVGGLKYG